MLASCSQSEVPLRPLQSTRATEVEHTRSPALWEARQEGHVSQIKPNRDNKTIIVNKL